MLHQVTDHDVSVWMISADRYQAIQGVKQPYIAEISPMQYGLMGKAARLRYDRQRAAEWDASAACKREWASLVIHAFDRGDFALDSAAVHPEALQIIRRELHQRAERAAQAAEVAERQAARITCASQLTIGQRVWHRIYSQHVVISKINRKTARFRLDTGREMISDICLFDRERDA